HAIAVEAGVQRRQRARAEAIGERGERLARRREAAKQDRPALGEARDHLAAVERLEAARAFRLDDVAPALGERTNHGTMLARERLPRGELVQVELAADGAVAVEIGQHAVVAPL